MKNPESPEPFSFLENPRRTEIWRKEIRVVNAIREMGLDANQSIEGDTISPENCIDVDNRALRKEKCVSTAFGRPHAGEFVPEELWDKMTTDGKKTIAYIDRATGDIFSSENIPSVGTKISRFVIDPNRSLVEKGSTNVPGSVLWKKTISGGEMYLEGSAPSQDEINDLSEQFYISYYDGAMSVVGSLTDRREFPNERVLFIDGHSFPINESKEILSYYKDYYNLQDPKEIPMFVIGDRDGFGCDDDIVGSFEQALKKNFNSLPEKDKLLITRFNSGNLVGRNFPYKGVHNVDFYSQRPYGVNAFQLELNESMYMNDENGDYFKGERSEDAIKVVQKLLEKTVLDIDQVLKGK